MLRISYGSKHSPYLRLVKVELPKFIQYGSSVPTQILMSSWLLYWDGNESIMFEYNHLVKFVLEAMKNAILVPCMQIMTLKNM